MGGRKLLPTNVNIWKDNRDRKEAWQIDRNVTGCQKQGWKYKHTARASHNTCRPFSCCNAYMSRECKTYGTLCRHSSVAIPATMDQLVHGPREWDDRIKFCRKRWGNFYIKIIKKVRSKNFFFLVLKLFFIFNFIDSVVSYFFHKTLSIAWFPTFS